MPIPNSGSFGMDRLNFEFNEDPNNTQATKSLGDMGETYLGLESQATVSYSDFRQKPTYYEHFYSNDSGDPVYGGSYTLTGLNFGVPSDNRKLLVITIRSGGYAQMYMSNAILRDSNGGTISTTRLLRTTQDDYYSAIALLTDDYITSGTSGQISITTTSNAAGSQYVYVIPLYGMECTTALGSGNNSYIRSNNVFYVGAGSGNSQRGMFFGAVIQENHDINATREWTTNLSDGNIDGLTVPTEWKGFQQTQLGFMRSLCFFDNRNTTTDDTGALSLTFDSTDKVSKSGASVACAVWVSEE